MPESRAPRKTVESAGSSTAAHAANGQVRRILYVEANEDGTVGGSHQALFELVVNLDRSRFAPIVLFYQDNVFAARLRDRGIEVCLYDAVRAQERRIRQTRSRLRRLPEYAYTILRRLRFLRQYGIDLIHINNSPRIGDDDWLPAARLLGIACVASVRGDASGPVGGWVRRKLFLGFDHYLPVSQYIASSMSRVGVPSERMDLVYDGVDLTSLRRRVQRSRDDVRRELSVPADGLLALMVGNIRHWKGQHVVLAALQKMEWADRGQLKVAFAGAVGPGDRAYQDELNALVKSAGLEQQVMFLGARSDVPDLLNSADIALHASIKPEPFGLVIVEAMAFGKPVVAANTGGPAETVSLESGITYDPKTPAALAEILATLLRDPVRRAALSAGALQRAEMFTSARYVSGVEGVYARLFPPRSKARYRR